MIDIIIPIYNINIKQLRTCLFSIVSQTIVKDIKITIIDDGSTITYDDNFNLLIDQIKQFISINILRYEENHGPGYARQYGIDHTNNDYISFIDADDMLSPIAMECLFKILDKYPNKAIAIAQFYKLDTEQMLTNVADTQLTWVFAKLYRRSVIEEYGFSFNTNKICSYANEDVGFNIQFQHVLGDECLILIKEPLYYWSDLNKNSMTRKNDREYEYNQGHKGYVFNFIESYIKTKDKADAEKSKNYAFKHLIDIYTDYSQNWIKIESNNLTDELLKYSVLYYNKVFKEFDDFNNDTLKKYWEIYCRDKKKGFNHFLRYVLIVRNEALK